MALFKMRDSWNVWREKVNRAIGNVEEIDADEIVYDNTDSGLTATNAQSAIDEVAGDIGTVGGNLTTLSTAISGSYVLDSIGVIEHDPATETYGEVMKDIGNKFKTLVEADTDDSIYIPFRMFLPGLATVFVALRPSTKNDVSDQYYISGGNGSATLQTIFNGSIKTDNNNGTFGMTINNGSTSSVSYTDKASSASSTTEKSYLEYFKFKKI